jgi:long-chain acyl-CoA synthetase
MEPSTLQFFYELGIPVVNGYGLTEAGTALTLNDLKPFRADTVGKPLPGVDLRVLNPDSEGIGEIAAHGKTVMSHYLDDPELTAETIVDGWLLTGDLGRFDASGHLQLFGRKKNMIVTEGGKNIYPEDIENAFDRIAVKEYSIFASDYIWPARGLGHETLVLVLHLEQGQEFTEGLKQEIVACNRRLPDFKRVGGLVIWEKDFPRTAAMKIKRMVLAEEIRKHLSRAAIVEI